MPYPLHYPPTPVFSCVCVCVCVSLVLIGLSIQNQRWYKKVDMKWSVWRLGPVWCRLRHWRSSCPLTRLVFSGVGLVDLVVEPHVGHGHPVLGEGAGLVGADGGGGAQGLHSLQVLYQAVLLGHALGGQGQTHLQINKHMTRVFRKHLLKCVDVLCQPPPGTW